MSFSWRYRSVWLFFALCSELLCGCEVERETRGHVLSKEIVTELRKRTRATKSEVLDIIGEPSFCLPYDQNTWYYVGQAIDLEAFFKPKIVKTTGYAMRFSPDNKLEELTEVTSGMNIGISTEESPLPSSHRAEFLKRIFRNVGRFPPQLKK